MLLTGCLYSYHVLSCVYCKLIIGTGILCVLLIIYLVRYLR